MNASLKISTEGLKKLAARINNPGVRAAVERVPQQRAVAAIVAQAISDNFDQEGPGWEPLKAKTIRQSVSKKIRKRLSLLSDEEVLEEERKARKKGSDTEPSRRILQRTGLLKKTVTVPGFIGTSKPKKGGKAVSGANIWRVEGTNLVWGTNLPYAGVHNNGDPKRKIPKREFLTIRAQWKYQLQEFVVRKMFDAVWNAFKGTG